MFLFQDIVWSPQFNYLFVIMTAISRDESCQIIKCTGTWSCSWARFNIPPNTW